MKKIFINSLKASKLAIFLLLLCCSFMLNAQSGMRYYWVGKGDGMNWNDLQNWSSTSGGPGGIAGGISDVPTTSNTVVFDKKSVFYTYELYGESGYVVISGNVNCDSLLVIDCDAPVIFDVGFYNYINIHGSLILQAGTIFEGYPSINFNSGRPVESIEINGMSLGESYYYCGVTFNGSAVFKIIDDYTIFPDIVINAGTLDLNGKNISCTAMTINSGGTIKCIGSTIECIKEWNSENGPVITPTHTANSLIKMGLNKYEPSFKAKHIDQYHNVEFYGTHSSTLTDGKFNRVSIFNTNTRISDTQFSGITIDSLIISSTMPVRFCNVFVNKYFEAKPQGCGGLVRLYAVKQSYDIPAYRTITLGASADVVIENAAIHDLIITGAPAVASNSLDWGNNNGFTFTTLPNSGDDFFWIGGSGNWSDPDHWSNSSGGTSAGCIPSIYDNVFFDENSGLVQYTMYDNPTVFMDIDAWCNNMTWNNVPGTPYFKMSNGNIMINGSLTLQSSLKFAGWAYSFIYFISNEPGNTITTHGAKLPRSIFFKSIEGTGGWKLLDDLDLSEYNTNNSYAAIFFDRGHLDVSGKKIFSYIFYTESDDATDGFSGKLPSRTLNIKDAAINCDGWTYTGGQQLTSSLTDNSNIIASNFYCKSDDYYNNVFLKNSYGMESWMNNYSNNTGIAYFNKITIGSSKSYIQTYPLDKATLQPDSLIFSGYGSYYFGRDLNVGKYIGTPEECGGLTTIGPATNIYSPAPSVTFKVLDNAIPQSEQVKIKNTDFNNVSMDVSDYAANYEVLNCNFNGVCNGWDNIPGTPQTFYWVGRTGNWSEKDNWSLKSGLKGGYKGDGTGCLPGPNDNVIFDDGSFDASDQIVTINSIAYCDSMTWCGSLYNPRFIIDNTALNIHGSLQLQSGMKFDGLQYQSFIHFLTKRANESIRTNGVGFGVERIYFNAADKNCTWTFLDDFELAFSDNRINFYRGTLNLNGNTLRGLKRFNGNDIYSGTDRNDRNLIITNSTIRGEINNIYMPYITLSYFNYAGDLSAQNSNLIFYRGDNSVFDCEPNAQYHNLEIFDYSNYGYSFEICRGKFNKITTHGDVRFCNSASDIIETDTIVLDNSQSFVYEFASGSTFKVNKAAYMSGSACSHIFIKTTNESEPVFFDILKPAANYSGILGGGTLDTLLIDYAYIHGVQAVTGADNAHLYKGMHCPDVPYASGAAWAYGLGSSTTPDNPTTDTYNIDWARMDVFRQGATPFADDRLISCRFLPYTLRSTEFGPGPFAKFKWFKCKKSTFETQWNALEGTQEEKFNKISSIFPILTTAPHFNVYTGGYYLLCMDYGNGCIAYDDVLIDLQILEECTKVELCEGTYLTASSLIFPPHSYSHLLIEKATGTDEYEEVNLVTDPILVKLEDTGRKIYFYDVGADEEFAIVEIKVHPFPSAPAGKNQYTLCNESTVADLIARLQLADNGEIKIFYESADIEALDPSTPLESGHAYWASQKRTICESCDKLRVVVDLQENCDMYQIWNWADLAYINTLIDNEFAPTPVSPKMSDYTEFVLMQDLGSPNVPGSYGEGAGCTYTPDERKKGCYGYENFDGTNFLLTGNLLLVGESAVQLNRDAWNANGWIPVGDAVNPFSSHFDGLKHEINELWINRGTGTQGLFGYVQGDFAGTKLINDLGVNVKTTDKVFGGNVTGALAGTVENMEINSCYSNGKVEGYFHVGGIVGTATHSTIANCYSNAVISAFNSAGGLVGKTTAGNITNCYTTGTVTIPLETDGAAHAGGLVGHNTANITNGYTTGKITGRENIGGLLGTTDNATITKCYANGIVEGQQNSIGGLIGRAEPNTPSIANCFALNPEIIAPAPATDVGRVIGNMLPFYSNNFAVDSMKVRGVYITTGTRTNKDGETIAACGVTDKVNNVFLNPAFGNWTDFATHWTFDYAGDHVSVVPTTNLPVLKVFKHQLFPNSVQPPHIELEEYPVAPTSISSSEGNTVCENFGTILTAVGGDLGSAGFYEWGTGNCGENMIAGKNGPTLNVDNIKTTTNYWVRIATTAPCGAYSTTCAEFEVKVDKCNSISTQVLTCWAEDTINVAKLLEIDPCASPSINFSYGTTTKLGATVKDSDGKMVYVHAVNAGKPVLGIDTVYFTLNCGVTQINATLVISVVNCPDNVDLLECVGPQIGFEFEIKEVWRNGLNDINLYQSPMIGDMDGDGIPEIVVARAISAPEQPSYRIFQNLYVFKGNGSNRNNPTEITTVLGNYHQTGAYALARVPVAPGDTVALIVMHGHDGFLYSYTLPGKTNPWPGGKSSHTITDSYNQISDRGSVAFADFDNCGKPEIYIGNRIFDAATGKLLVDGELYGANKGKTFAVLSTAYLFHPTVADIDGDGKLEYIAGNSIYKVNIGTRSGANPHLDPKNNMELFIESEPIIVAGKTVTDGVTAVADFTGDGQLDVLVATTTEANVVAIAVWNIQTKKVLGTITNGTCEYTFGIPFIGDIDANGVLEILMTTRPADGPVGPGDLNGFRLESTGPSTYSLEKRYFQQFKDSSGSTGITLFDFNQSGEARLVYRDEDTLRIMRAVPDLGKFKTEATFSVGSGTRYEYAVVADADADGAAEIIVTGCDGPGNSKNYGYLRVYKSNNEHNWAPARKVWNQYNYNVVNVNEDLTIPKYQMNPATFFPNGKQPFNNYLQQQTRIDAAGDPYRLLANIIWAKPDPTMVFAGDSLVFHACIKNIGEVALQKPFYVSYYKNDTILTNLLATDEIYYSVKKDSTLCLRLVLNNISANPNIGGINSIWISINDKGTGKYPFQAQCDAEGRWKFDFPTKEIKAQVLTCWEKDTVDVVKLLKITPCPSPKVNFASTTTKLGATVSADGGNVLYAYATNAGEPVLGNDTVYFTLICNGKLQIGVLILDVVKCPDNVDFIKCDKRVTGFQWAIKEQGRSVETNVSTYVTPLVGDLKGTGESVQIVAAARNGSGGSNAIYVYEGADVKLEPTKISTIEFDNAAGVLAMARIPRPAPHNDTIPIIVVRGNDNFLYAYNPNKPGYLEWKSNAVAQIPANASSNRQGSVIFFADFDNCGTPEICCGNSIFNSVDGILLTQGHSGGNKGDYTVGPGIGSARLSMPAVADIDGDGKLEYIAGTQIYKVNINRTGTSTMPIITDINQIPTSGGENIKDGYTVVADFNGDGLLEILVASRTSTGFYGLAIWDPRSGTVLARTTRQALRTGNTAAPALGFPFIGDIDGDGKLEILCTSTHDESNKCWVNGYRWEKGSTTIDLVYRTDFFDGTSGCTGITLFDFNQSGKANLVYRDERDLRIIQAVPGTPVGTVGTFQTLKTYSATSGTGWEMPVVADVDNDGAAEIVVAGDEPSGAGSAHYGTLRVYRSGNEYNWAPARKVWNQVAYNAININEDLTVPQYQMNSAKFFPNGKQPFNNFLQQQTRINPDGNPYALLAEIVWAAPAPTMVYDGDSLVFNACIKNIGEVALQKPFYVTYYKNDTIVPNVLVTDSVLFTVKKDSTVCFRHVLRNISTLPKSKGMTSVWISINDKGTGKFPYQAECDTGGRWEFKIPAKEIQAEVSTCVPSSEINVIKLLNKTPCTPSSVMITGVSKLGANVSGTDSCVIYKYAKIADQPVIGNDTIDFILSCNGFYYIGKLCVTVEECLVLCDKITMTATATPATCPGNGSITLTFSGEDIDDLRLDNAEWRLTPYGGTPTTWNSLPGTGTVRVIAGVSGGTYKVEVRAICWTGKDGVEVIYSANVSVGTTWVNPLEYEISRLLPSLDCTPTGRITLDIAYGAPPYTINITSKPDEYTGPTTFTTTLNRFSIYDLPAGDYTINVVDQCGWVPGPQNVTIDLMVSDLPDIYTWVYAKYGSCNELTLNVKFNVTSYVDYEYAFVAKASDTKVWIPCNTTSFIFPITLPAATFMDFCKLSPIPDLGIFSLRLKDCPEISQDWTITPPSNVCDAKPIYTSVDINSCVAKKLKISFGTNDAVCYPVYYIIAEGTPLEESGYITNSMGITSENEFPEGDYTIFLQEYGSNGRTWDDVWSAPSAADGQEFTHDVYYDAYWDYTTDPPVWNCKGKRMYISALKDEKLYPGTKIKYISGTDNYELPFGPVGTEKIIDNTHNSRWIELTSPYYNYSNAHPVPRGVYVFEVENTCEMISTYTFEISDIIPPSEFTYSLTPTCAGIEFRPTSDGSTGNSRLKEIDAYGNVTFATTRYYASVSTSPGWIDMSWAGTSSSPSGYLLLTESKVYEIQLREHSSGSWGCVFLSVFVDGPPLKTYDADINSAYICEGEDVGHIYVKAKGGTPFIDAADQPYYNYWIVAQGDVPDGTKLAGPNTTGKFDFGEAGMTYLVIIEDACNKRWPVPVTMFSLGTGDGIAWPKDKTYCEGGTIELNSIGLGEVDYLWYKLPDITTPIFNAPKPRIYNATAADAGTYMIKVKPEECGDEIIEYLNVYVNTAPTAPTSLIAEPGKSACVGTPIKLTASGGEEGDDSALFEWGQGNCTWQPYPEISLGTANFTTIYNSMGGDGWFWVRRTGTGACAGTKTDCIAIDLNFTGLSSAGDIQINGSPSVCYGTGTAITADVMYDYFDNPYITGTPVFRWYASATATDYLFEGNPFPTGNLTSNKTYWVSVSGDNRCEGEANMGGRKPVTVMVKQIPEFELENQEVCDEEFVFENLVSSKTPHDATVLFFEDDGDYTPILVPTRELSAGNYTFWAKVVFNGCESDYQSVDVKVNECVKFTIIYDGNGNTGGTAPIDNTKYLDNDMVTIKGKGDLTKNCYRFKGWAYSKTAIVPDFAYNEGTTTFNISTFNITQNVTLYAVWEAVTLSIGSVFATNEPACDHNGSIQMNVSGGSGSNYEYSIDNWLTFNTTGVFTGLQAGYYNIQVRDANAPTCPAAQTDFELQNKGAALDIELSIVQSALACTGSTGSFLVLVKNGTAPYYYKLNGETASHLLPENGIIANKPAGEYVVEIFDSQGCYTGGMIHLTSGASTIKVTDFSVLHDPTCEDATGAITFRVTGINVNPAYYQLDDMEKVTLPTSNGAITLTGLSAGKHTLYVADKCGNDSFPFELFNSDNTLVAEAKTEPLVTDCDGNVTQPGRIIVKAEGGTGPYYYKYRDDVAWAAFKYPTYDTIFVNATGTYKVEVRDDLTDCIFTLYGEEVTKEVDCSITLDIKVFLEGVVKPGTFATGYLPFMTNYIQDPNYIYKPGMPNFKLPTTSPYPAPGNTYPLINSPGGPAGKVVDWIWVEIWSNFAPYPGDPDFTLYDVIEHRALLLKTDGSIVDVDGNLPKFRPYSGNKVHIVVKHRNHLSVMSRQKLDFFGVETLPYNFTTGANQALDHIYADYPSMRMYTEVGVSCLWAGDLNQDEMVEPSDISMYEYGWRLSLLGNYNNVQDVNMDGFADYKDGAFILQNFKYNIFSPAAYYIKR